MKNPEKSRIKINQHKKLPKMENPTIWSKFSSHFITAENKKIKNLPKYQKPKSNLHIFLWIFKPRHSYFNDHKWDFEMYKYFIEYL